MAAEKSSAIILRLVEFSETSLIVTMFTREFGKISALAKGARRKKSPFEAALDLLAICQIVFLHKKSDSLDLLTEAKLQRRFRSAPVNLKRLYCGYYVAELLAKLTDEADPHPELFDLAAWAIVELDDIARDPIQTLLRFEMRMLALLGHQPMLRQCVVCAGDPIAEGTSFGKRNFVGLIEGGRLCVNCRPGKTNVVRVGADTLELLDANMDEGDRWLEFAPDAASSGEARQLVNRFLSHLIGSEPRMQQFLKTTPTRTKPKRSGPES